MIFRSSFLAFPFLALGQAASADVPNVVTDMAPIQSLVQQVMGDLATPPALMPAGASPHGFSLRPSDARALQQADLVFWTGVQVEPWLEEMIDKVAGGAVSVPLAAHEGTSVLPLREGAAFERHVHEEGDEDHADHMDEHADEHMDEHAEDEGHDAHEDHDGGDGHDDHDEHDAHAMEGIDGHSWLDPMNGRVWLGVIAEELAKADPDHAETYRANAAAAQQTLDQEIDAITADLAPLSDLRFIVFHDAYHYFENRFDLAAAGSISLSDASEPSPARIREIQDTIKAQQVTCVFSEPQFNAGMVQTVLDGTEAKTVVIDPLGADLAPGAGFYADLMRNMAAAFVACAAD